MHLKFRPKYHKIVELLLYLAHSGRRLDKYQVVKLFYLADRLHLNRFGRPITQEQYFALDYGPVASTAKDLIEQQPSAFAKVGISELPFSIIQDGAHLCLGAPSREVNFDLFSKTDIAVVDEVIARFGDCSFDELFNETHRHEAYRRAWQRRGGARRSEMYYDEMIESDSKRRSLLEDLRGVSSSL